MGAESSAPRAAGRPAGRQDLGTAYANEDSTARARLILTRDGRHCPRRRRPQRQAELRAPAEQLTDALLVRVGGAS